jgi:hypothetical protein
METPNIPYIEDFKEDKKNEIKKSFNINNKLEFDDYSNKVLEENPYWFYLKIICEKEEIDLYDIKFIFRCEILQNFHKYLNRFNVDDESNISEYNSKKIFHLKFMKTFGKILTEEIMNLLRVMEVKEKEKKKKKKKKKRKKLKKKLKTNLKLNHLLNI